MSQGCEAPATLGPEVGSARCGRLGAIVSRPAMSLGE